MYYNTDWGAMFFYDIWFSLHSTFFTFFLLWHFISVGLLLPFSLPFIFIFCFCLPLSLCACGLFMRVFRGCVICLFYFFLAFPNLVNCFASMSFFKLATVIDQWFLTNFLVLLYLLFFFFFFWLLSIFLFILFFFTFLYYLVPFSLVVSTDIVVIQITTPPQFSFFLGSLAFNFFWLLLSPVTFLPHSPHQHHHQKKIIKHGHGNDGYALHKNLES